MPNNPNAAPEQSITPDSNTETGRKIASLVTDILNYDISHLPPDPEDNPSQAEHFSEGWLCDRQTLAKLSDKPDEYYAAGIHIFTNIRPEDQSTTPDQDPATIEKQIIIFTQGNNPQIYVTYRKDGTQSIYAKVPARMSEIDASQKALMALEQHSRITHES